MPFCEYFTGLRYSPNIPVPQIYNSPFSVRAAEWCPHAILTTLVLSNSLSLTGTLVFFFVPVPSWPKVFPPVA